MNKLKSCGGGPLEGGSFWAETEEQIGALGWQLQVEGLGMCKGESGRQNGR